LFAAHLRNLGFKRAQAELLFEGELDRLVHGTFLR
jgi:hypothetical protein